MSIWVIQPVGQLGNRLATFAHLVAFSLETGRPVYNPGFRENASAFEHLADNFLCRFPRVHSFNALRSPEMERRIMILARRFLRSRLCSRQLRLFDYLSLRVDEEHDLASLRGSGSPSGLSLRPRLLGLDGWMFRDHEALRRHREAVVSFLCWHPKVRRLVDEQLRAVRHPGRPLVGLHVRRGDFRSAFPHLFFEYDQYRALAGRMCELISPLRPQFLVCSNEPVPPTVFAGFDIIIGPGSAATDQYALSRCDYILGPLSTFSSWASFAGRVPACLLNSEVLPAALDNFRVCEAP